MAMDVFMGEAWICLFYLSPGIWCAVNFFPERTPDFKAAHFLFALDIDYDSILVAVSRGEAISDCF